MGCGARVRGSLEGLEPRREAPQPQCRKENANIDAAKEASYRKVTETCKIFQYRSNDGCL